VYSSIFTVALFTLFALNAYAQGPNDSGTYYQAADGKKGAELKTALCGIIYNRTERTYKQLWTDFQTTDKKENGKVWDMYSNLREMTFVTDQAGNYKKEGDVYNREHSWPNSWFGGEVQPMYTDLHHLYPTDGFVNNKRSNYAFGETNGESYKSANDFSKLGACTYPGYTGTVFEPNDDYKGDFARTYFYMVTCYEEKLPDWFTNYGTKEGVSQTIDGSKYPGLRDWQLEMLMKWTKNDPVSADKETPRNNAVYTIQNNRNPFIDYPGLEEYIWGSLKDVAFSYDHYQMPTAIITTQAERSTKDGVMYNLAGQVVDKSYKGIVIMNGKKFMNK
jgi:endonuclease I